MNKWFLYTNAARMLEEEWRQVPQERLGIGAEKDK
jgi:hypothetical protein